MKKALIYLLCTTLLLGLLSSCGLPEVGTAEEQTSTSQTSSGEETTSDEPAVLTVLQGSNDGWIRNFNPFTTSTYQFVRGFMYEYLVIYDTLNDNEEHMWLAEEVISEEDNKTLTIKVRQGIKWSDGEDFTAEDVAYSYTIFKDHPEIDFYGIWGENGKIEEVNIIDDYTVEVVGATANRFNRTELIKELPIIPHHIWSEIEDPSSYVQEDPVVTGAFSEIINFTPEMVVLGRNPTYWMADDLEVDELRIPQISGADSMLSLAQTGALDWTHAFIPNIEETYVQGDEYRKYWYGQSDGLRLAFNYMTKNENNLKAFNDPEFKKAVSLAVDRQSIIDSAMFGYVDLVVPTNTGLPPSLRSFMNDEAQAIMDEYSVYDPEKAKQILADAGYVDVDGDGFVENPDGTPIAFDILTPAGWTDYNSGAAIATQGIQEIGINASATTADASLVYESWQTGDHDVLYTSYGNTTNIWKFYYDTIGDQSRVLTPTWWSICQTNYVNDEMSALIDTMPTASDEEVIEVANQVEMHFAENMINIPLVYNMSLHIYNDSRFTGWATPEDPFVSPISINNDTKILQLLALTPVE